MILEWLMPLRRYGISNEITNPWAQCYLRPVFRLIEGETMTFEEPKAMTQDIPKRMPGFRSMRTAGRCAGLIC